LRSTWLQCNTQSKKKKKKKERKKKKESQNGKCLGKLSSGGYPWRLHKGKGYDRMDIVKNKISVNWRESLMIEA
jgi:hypothetical protein